MTAASKCAACGNEGGDLSLCSGCKMVSYCNAVCQKNDWRNHKAACKGRIESIRRQERMKHEILPVGDPSDEFVFMYTAGIAETHPSKVEFITMHVRPRDVNKVGNVYNFLAERLLEGHDVRPYQNAESHDIPYAIIPLEDDVKRALLDNYATECREDANLLLIMPRSELPYTLATVPAGAEEICGTGREVEVGEKALMIAKIRSKWTHQLIQHINGDTLDNRLVNLRAVSFYDAFAHPQWKVDWVCYLEDDEIAFVRENMDLFAEIYRPSGANA